MVSFQQLKVIEYQCLANLNLYDSPQCDSLATQAAAGRHLQVLSLPDHATAIEVRLCEDDYPGWLSWQNTEVLQPAVHPYKAIALSSAEISSRLPKVISFTQLAMQQPNYYLWGGTVGPNYDCSGLIQAAFASVGIWLPRDAYQQQAFVQKINFEELRPGDLVFFGTTQKVTHVGLYLGEKFYIHSSGEEIGRNGIGIDQLSEQGDQVSRSYFQQLHSWGRVVKCYEPQSAKNIDVKA